MPSLGKWVYDVIYRFSKLPWDSDTVPPELEALVKQDSTRGRALDLGCGTGTNSIYMAQQGFTVTGVDFSPKAIELAREKAMQAGATVDFRLADVTHLDFLREPINLALDVGCFYGLDAKARTRYVANLARLLRPGGQFLLFALDPPTPFWPRFLPTEVERTFGTQFELKRTAHGVRPSGRTGMWYWFVRG